LLFSLVTGNSFTPPFKISHHLKANFQSGPKQKAVVEEVHCQLSHWSPESWCYKPQVLTAETSPQLSGVTDTSERGQPFSIINSTSPLAPILACLPPFVYFDFAENFIACFSLKVVAVSTTKKTNH
jgi:hypothetical protein